MQIEPTIPHIVKVKSGEFSAAWYLVQLNDHDIELRGSDYLEKGTNIQFRAEFFHGEGFITELSFAHYHFTYTIQIKKITFQPGFLVNKEL